jgi:hypothetical protein
MIHLCPPCRKKTTNTAPTYRGHFWTTEVFSSRSSRRTSFRDPYPASLQPYQDRNKRDGLASPEQNSSRHIKAECSERINRRYCRLEPNSETFSNFFRTALRLPAGIAAVSHMLPPASAAAEERPRDMCKQAAWFRFHHGSNENAQRNSGTSEEVLRLGLRG